MITVLRKIFVKEELETLQGKKGMAVLCSVLGIVLNVMLFGVKYLIGMVSGSMSIMADAFNNITDAGTSLAMLIGVKIASYGKGDKHPMGHGRFEWIISSMMAFLVMAVGWNLLTDSIGNLGSTKAVEANVWMIGLMVLSVGVKFYMYLYNRKFGRIIDSETMKAVSADSISDAVATTAVIISVVISWLFHINVDGYCGILVSIFIMYNGFQSMCDTVSRIMGAAPEKEELMEIRELVREEGFFKKILELHVEDYGMGTQRVVLRVAFEDECGSMELQEHVQSIYQRIWQEKGMESLIMTEQLLDQELVQRWQEELDQEVRNIVPFSYVRGMRMVGGNAVRSLYCEISLPKDKESREPELEKCIADYVSKHDKTVHTYTTFSIFHDISNHQRIKENRVERYDEFMEKHMFPNYFKGDMDEHYAILNKRLQNVHNKAVLDVGCGSGNAVNFLAEDNSYTGLEVNPAFQKIVLDKLQKAGFVNPTFVNSNACEMPFKPRSYDVVLCNLAMQFIVPSESFIHEVKRVLRDGGIFVGSVPVSDYGKQMFRYNGDVSTSARLKEILEMEGFQVELSAKINGAVCYFTAVKC